MPHFSMSTLVEFCNQGDELDWAMLEGVATERLLLASGFAEGRSGQGINVSTLRARRCPDGYVLNGAKKPCSLMYSMDLLTANVLVEEEDGSEQPAMALIPAATPGSSASRSGGAPCSRAPRATR
jgi:alkylation response protein AidB-like acyl-CoA dehydrogenase